MVQKGTFKWGNGPKRQKRFEAGERKNSKKTVWKRWNRRVDDAGNRQGGQLQVSKEGTQLEDVMTKQTKALDDDMT